MPPGRVGDASEPTEGEFSRGPGLVDEMIVNLSEALTALGAARARAACSGPMDLRFGWSLQYLILDAMRLRDDLRAHTTGEVDE